MIPDLHEFKVVSTGAVNVEPVLGFTLTRAEFREAVEQALREIDPEWVSKVREIITPVVDTTERFPLGTWISHARGCGCIVVETIVAAGLIAREAAMNEAKSMRLDVRVLLTDEYGAQLGGALEDFGIHVDHYVTDRVVELSGRYSWSADEFEQRLSRVVFIQD